MPYDKIIGVDFKTKKIRPVMGRTGIKMKQFFFGDGLAADLALPQGPDCFSDHLIEEYANASAFSNFSKVRIKLVNDIDTHIAICDLCHARVIRREWQVRKIHLLEGVDG